MKCLNIIALFFLTKSMFAQVPTVRQLTKIFKKSIRQESKNKIRIGSNPWIICNTDSAFFNSDTIFLNDDLNFYYQSNSCCDFIEWTFYESNMFVQSESQVCKEPSSGKVLKGNHYYVIRLSKNKKKQTSLTVYQGNKIVQTFNVIAYESLKTPISGQPYQRITLVKINKE